MHTAIFAASTRKHAVVMPPITAGMVLNFCADVGVTLVGGTDVADVVNNVVAGPCASVVGPAGKRPLINNAWKNGKKAFAYDGVNRYLSATFAAPLAQPMTYFVAADQPDAAGYRFMMSSTNPADANDLTNDRQNVPFGVSGYAGNGFKVATSLAAGAAIAAVFRGAGSTIWLDGVLGVIGFSGGQSMDGITIGNIDPGRDSDVYTWNGNIGWVLGYTGAMADADIVVMSTFLQDYYGL